MAIKENTGMPGHTRLVKKFSGCPSIETQAFHLDTTLALCRPSPGGFLPLLFHGRKKEARDRLQRHPLIDRFSLASQG
jgi:hypothetical protein